MANIINEENLENLAELARLELNPEKEEKILKDLQVILGHFEELKSVSTDFVEPMTGGTHLKNSVRSDEKNGNGDMDTGKGVSSFPENKNGYLKVPPVF